MSPSDFRTLLLGSINEKDPVKVEKILLHFSGVPINKVFDSLEMGESTFDRAIIEIINWPLTIIGNDKKFELISGLYKYKENKNSLRGGGWGILLECIYCAQPMLLEAFLKDGLDVNFRIENGTSPLLGITSRRDDEVYSEILDIILLYKPDINYVDEKGKSALSKTIINGNEVWAQKIVDTVEFLEDLIFLEYAALAHHKINMLNQKQYLSCMDIIGIKKNKIILENTIETKNIPTGSTPFDSFGSRLLVNKI